MCERHKGELRDGGCEEDGWSLGGALPSGAEVAAGEEEKEEKRGSQKKTKGSKEREKGKENATSMSWMIAP